MPIKTILERICRRETTKSAFGKQLKLIVPLLIVFQLSTSWADQTACDSLQDNKHKIVVIGVDDKTIDSNIFGDQGFVSMKQLRGTNATLIEQLNRSGAMGVAIDFYYTDDPSYEIGTRAFADSIQAGKVPVVIAIKGSLNEAGQISLDQNTPLLKTHGNLSEATINLIQATNTDPEGESQFGPYKLIETLAPNKSFANDLLTRTGLLKQNQLQKMGILEIESFTSNGNAAQMFTLNPKIKNNPPQSFCTVSYVDVYKGLHQEYLKNALVLVGVTLKNKDSFDMPDPIEAPELKDVNGIYLHAAGIRRILFESTQVVEKLSQITRKESEYKMILDGLQKESSQELRNFLKDVSSLMTKSFDARRAILDSNYCQQNSLCLADLINELNTLTVRIERQMMGYTDNADLFTSSQKTLLIKTFKGFEGLLVTGQEYSAALETNDLNRHEEYLNNAQSILNVATFLFN